jgi:hypothetical protein
MRFVATLCALSLLSQVAIIDAQDGTTITFAQPPRVLSFFLWWDSFQKS